jgi:cytochrome-b5 reductase
VIKVYFKDVHPRFPEGGKLTQFMEAMKLGDTIDAKGPLGEFIFDASPPRELGTPELTHARSNEKQPFDKIGFIAGGSGITPVLQVLTNLLVDPKRKVSAWVLYANQTPDDILCGDILNALAKDKRVKIWYTVDRPSDDWQYSKGFINEQMVREHLPPAGPNTLVMMCGPPPMIKFACIPNLEKHGYTDKSYFSF